jgi:CHASE3 domain sensor protein
MSEEMMDRYTALRDIRYAVLSAANDLRDWIVHDDTDYQHAIEQAIDDLDDAARQLLKAEKEMA